MPMVKSQVASQIKVRDFSEAQVSIAPAECASWQELRTQLMQEAKRGLKAKLEAEMGAIVGTDESAEEVEVKFKFATEGGEGDAMYLLGAWYQLGMNGLAVDKAQARAWYERSAAARDPRGMAGFGGCLLYGLGGPKNTSLGLVYVTEGAHLGSDLGAYLLGDAFAHGKYGVAEERVLPPSTARVQARFWLKKIVDGECKVKHLAEECLAEAATWLRELNE